MLRRDEKPAEVFGWLALVVGTVMLAVLSVWLWKAAVMGRAMWGS